MHFTDQVGRLRDLGGFQKRCSRAIATRMLFIALQCNRMRSTNEPQSILLNWTDTSQYYGVLWVNPYRSMGYFSSYTSTSSSSRLSDLFVPPVLYSPLRCSPLSTACSIFCTPAGRGFSYLSSSPLCTQNRYACILDTTRSSCTQHNHAFDVVCFVRDRAHIQLS